MPKIPYLAKHLALPVATLVFVFIAGGSAVTVATTSTQESSSAALKAEAAPEPALAEFCDQFWGELESEGRICRFSQWFHLNLKHAGSDTVLTGIPILPGDTLRVEASSVPEAWVGGNQYDASEEKIVAASSGYLSFRADPQLGVFSVERLSLERCFAERGGKIDAAACPEAPSIL